MEDDTTMKEKKNLENTRIMKANVSLETIFGGAAVLDRIP